jgi:hypothetical protein
MASLGIPPAGWGEHQVRYTTFQHQLTMIYHSMSISLVLNRCWESYLMVQSKPVMVTLPQNSLESVDTWPKIHDLNLKHLKTLFCFNNHFNIFRTTPFSPTYFAIFSTFLCCLRSTCPRLLSRGRARPGPTPRGQELEGVETELQRLEELGVDGCGWFTLWLMVVR